MRLLLISSVIFLNFISVLAPLAFAQRAGLIESTSRLSSYGRTLGDTQSLRSFNIPPIFNSALGRTSGVSGTGAPVANDVDPGAIAGGLTDEQFKEIVTLINDSVSKMSATLSTTTDGVIAQWSRTNDGFLKLVDPKNMFLVGAGAAAGGVIGAALAKGFLELGRLAIGKAYGLITKSDKRKTDLAGANEFNQARELYRGLKKSAPDLEAAIQNSFDLFMDGRKLGVTMLGVLDHHLTEAVNNVEKGKMPDERWKTAISAAVTVLSGISGYGSLASTAKSIEKLAVNSPEWKAAILGIRDTFRNMDPDRLLELADTSIDEYCSTMDLTWATLTQMEKDLQSARVTMISREAKWSASIYDQFMRNDVKSLSDARKGKFLYRVEKTHRLGIKRLDEVNQRNLDQLYRSLVNDCLSFVGKSSEAKHWCKLNLTMMQSEQEAYDALNLTTELQRTEFNHLGLMRRVKTYREYAKNFQAIEDFDHAIAEHSSNVSDSNKELIADPQVVEELQRSVMSFVEDLRREQGARERVLLNKHLEEVQLQTDRICHSRTW